MRVAFNSLTDSLINQLGTLSTRQNLLQNQAATGQRITQLEDDPAAMRQALGLQVTGGQLGQYRKNIATLQQQATSSYTAMSGLQTLSQRAGEIATLADGTKSPQDLQVYAGEVTQLIQQAALLMNGKFQGDYQFGGTKTGQPPFVVATDANGNITSVTYQGNDSVSSAEIAQGTTLSAQVPGANTSGSGPAGLITDSRSGADFFNHLIALQNHLLAGDTATIQSSDNAALAKDEDHITLQIGTNGVIQSQLNAADSLAAAQTTNVTEMVSQDADVNLAETLTKLSAAQMAYQAALQSGANLLNRSASLMNYIQ